jgi:uncharacterized protein (TIGR02996 family)
MRKRFTKEVAMQTEAEAFLQRIRAYPDDDAPRLIFADWLEEQSHRLPGAAERARFIRVQITLAQLAAEDTAPSGPARTEREASVAGLMREEAVLLDAHRDEWTAPFRGLANGPVFHRGFVEEVKVSARDFIRRAHELFATGPIRHLHLLDVGGSLPAVVQSAYLSRLYALNIYGMHIGEPLARAVAHSPHLAGLKVLRLGRNRFSDDAAEQLATSDVLSNLLELDLSGNELGETGARALAASAHLGALRSLELRENHLGPVGAVTLASSERLGALNRLGLAQNEIGVARLQSLGRAHELLRVRVLDLSRNGLNAAGIHAILNRPSTPDALPARLEELDLSHNELGSDGARALAASPQVAGLSTLRLVNCAIGDEGARTLAESPHLNQLGTLDLENNPIGDPGLRAFLRPSHLMGLRHLNYPKIGPSTQMRHDLDMRFPRSRG